MTLNSGSALRKSPDSDRATAGELEFCRLTVDDLSEIEPLVNTVWRATYGSTGCPVFTEDYLNWTYGGPDRHLHQLIGARLDGTLVALKALLFRAMSYNGQPLSAHLSTHLTIDPGLPLGHRLALVTEFSHPHPLSGEYPFGSAEPVDISLCFYEHDKTIISRTSAGLDRARIQTSVIAFHQAIVNPVALRSFVGETAQTNRYVRVCTETDSGVLAELFNRVASKTNFSLCMTRERIKHHVFGAPQGEAYIYERNGNPEGFLSCYSLETFRQGKTTKVLVAEMLISNGGPNVVSALLLSAVNYATSIGARGVVLENPTWVDSDQRQQVGVVASARRMVMAVRSVRTSLEFDGTFLVDIK